MFATKTTIAAENKTTAKVIIILGSFVFIYTLSRAYLLSITWDESYTYIEYIKNNILLQDTFNEMSANNHLLNTLGGIIFTKLSGYQNLHYA